MNQQDLLDWAFKHQKEAEAARNKLTVDQPYWEFHEGVFTILEKLIHDIENGVFEKQSTGLQ